MRFVDEATVKVKAGDGGPGIVAWRREKFVPMGGPAGGDGGKGGDVIFEAKEGMSSLLDLKQRSLITAEDGSKGQSKNKSGRNGQDLLVFVPVGTEIEARTTTSVNRFDLLRQGQRAVICRGGDGGFGNSHFKSRLQNAPDKSTAGFKGEEKEVSLSLKLMADIGLLGFPNAGKSTLLTRMSNARPKIASYPFTTIRPMVGVCELDIAHSMVMADIPGLIEGASDGQGLGFRFLRHLERVRLLCHLIDGASDQDPMERYRVINRELMLYSEQLASCPQIVAINKIDCLDHEQRQRIERFSDDLKSQGVVVHAISATDGQGVDALKWSLFNSLKSARGDTGSQKVFDPLRNLYG